MKPPVFASIVAFGFNAFITFWHYPFKTDAWVSAFLMLAIGISAFYYYYLTMVSQEIPWPIHNGASKRRRNINWFIEAFQYIGFFFLWNALAINLTFYASTLTALNISYILWYVHNRKIVFVDKSWIGPLVIDLAGLALSIGLLSFSFYLPPEIMKTSIQIHNAFGLVFLTGLITAVSIAGFVVSVRKFRYNPFKSKNDKNDSHETQPIL